MPDQNREIQQFVAEFENCRKTLLALGDENRQHMILEMMRMEQCGGVRVGAITQKTNLSRPAVSHHIQILKDAGLLKMRREGTKHYYLATSKNYFLMVWVRDFVLTKVLEIPEYFVYCGVFKTNF